MISFSPFERKTRLAFIAQGPGWRKPATAV